MANGPDRREFMKLALIGGTASLTRPADGFPKSSLATIDLAFTRRDSNDQPVVSKETIDPRKVGIVVVDMWNYHWCRTALGRAKALVPRMNAAFDLAREMGMQLIFLPSDVIMSYIGYPQREVVLAMPYRAAPEISIPKPPPQPKTPPGGGSCMCGPGGGDCVVNYSWTALNPTLKIRDGDYIACGGQEMYNICQARGLTHLIYSGIHTNICVIGKPGAAVNMVKLGLNCALARDLTDAFTAYSPQVKFTPDYGTSVFIRYVERNLVPTVDLYAALQKAAGKKDSPAVDPVRITPWGRTFEDAVTVTLSAPHAPDAEIYYTLDGSEPTQSSTRYQEPFVLRATADIKAIGFRGGNVAALQGAAGFNRLLAAPPAPTIFLSEILPASASQGWPYDKKKPQINRSIVGKKLRIRGTVYDKGIGVAAPSRLVYTLKPEYERFVASAGLDDEIVGNDMGILRASFAGVVFRVYVDDKLLAESPMIRVQYVPWRFDVEIPKGSRELRLVVADRSVGEITSANRAPDGENHLNSYNYMCHGDWLNAGFTLKG